MPEMQFIYNIIKYMQVIYAIYTQYGAKVPEKEYTVFSPLSYT
jgi:hypothetical protein